MVGLKSPPQAGTTLMEQEGMLISAKKPFFSSHAYQHDVFKVVAAFSLQWPVQLAPGCNRANWWVRQ